MGLVPKKRFEDVLAEIEAQAAYKVKLPDRTAKNVQIRTTCYIWASFPSNW